MHQLAICRASYIEESPGNVFLIFPGPRSAGKWFWSWEIVDGVEGLCGQSTLKTFKNNLEKQFMPCHSPGISGTKSGDPVWGR